MFLLQPQLEKIALQSDFLEIFPKISKKKVGELFIFPEFYKFLEISKKNTSKNLIFFELWLELDVLANDLCSTLTLPISFIYIIY